MKVVCREQLEPILVDLAAQCMQVSLSCSMCNIVYCTAPIAQQVRVERPVIFRCCVRQVCNAQQAMRITCTNRWKLLTAQTTTNLLERYVFVMHSQYWCNTVT